MKINFSPDVKEALKKMDKLDRSEYIPNAVRRQLLEDRRIDRTDCDRPIMPSRLPYPYDYSPSPISESIDMTGVVPADKDLWEDRVAESIRQVLTESGVTKFEVKVKSPNNIECLFIQPAIVGNETFIASKPKT